MYNMQVSEPEISNPHIKANCKLPKQTRVLFGLSVLLFRLTGMDCLTHSPHKLCEPEILTVKHVEP